jgi:hypothetical protein
MSFAIFFVKSDFRNAGGATLRGGENSARSPIDLGIAVVGTFSPLFSIFPKDAGVLLHAVCLLHGSVCRLL